MPQDFAATAGADARLAAHGVSVVMPAYNEAECAGPCVDEVAGVLRALGRPFELVVVDDGSTDGTFDVLRAKREEVPELVVLRFASNCGQTAAFDAGFRASCGRYVATMDADLQNDPAELPRLLEMMGQWDVVCGYRQKRRDSALRRLSSRIANWTRNRLTHEQIRDTGCSLKVFRRECLAGLKLYRGMHRFLPTLLRMDGWRIAEAPVNHRPRPMGRAKYGIRNRLFRTLRDVFAVRWMQSRWLRYTIAERLG